MRRAFLFLMVIALVVPSHVAHGDEVFKRLLKARCLRCELGPGTQTSWKTGQPRSSPTHFGSEGVITFDSIDAKAGTARMIAGGATDVSVLPTPAGITFLEQTGTGNLVITTVFAQPDKPGSDRLVVVMSRHMDMSAGGPFPSQFHGTCTILQ